MPRHVRAEAKRGLTPIPQDMPKNCAALSKELQHPCHAQMIALALRRSEARKHRALRDADKFYNGVYRQFKAQ